MISNSLVITPLLIFYLGKYYVLLTINNEDHFNALKPDNSILEAPRTDILIAKLSKRLRPEKPLNSSVKEAKHAICDFLGVKKQTGKLRDSVDFLVDIESSVTPFS